VEAAEKTSLCDSCRIELEDERRVEREGKSFCCEGCRDGGPCIC
jgi:hypothetical protein